MTRRPGLTMTEVLIAIFVVAIGLAGVMSLVPFGAKQMSDALVADRATTHATTMDGLVRAYWREKVADEPTPTEPFWTALDNPGGGLTQLTTANDEEPSYPVVLDPIGWHWRGPTTRDLLGDAAGTSVPRRSMNAIINTGAQAPQVSQRMWSQADGFGWDEDSRPKVTYDVNGLPQTSSEMRELRYNAFAVIQRPKNKESRTATLKIVVFSNRPAGFFPNGTEQVLSVPPLTPGSTQITGIPTTVEIKKGSWLMDATIDAASSTAVPRTRHANFYRVVSAIDNGGGTWDIELNTPIRRADGGTGPIPTAGATPATATLVLMPGIAAVFERQPPLSGNTN